MIIIDLSRNIIKRYVEVSTPEKITSNSETVNGTVVSEGDILYVRIDGSSILTPVSSTIDIREGDRVLVLLQNHEATVIGSPTSATARLEELREMGGEVAELVNANKVVAGEIVAMQGLFEELTAKDVEITGKLTANEASIEALTAENATINGKLTAYQGYIEELQTDKIDATEVAAKYATIENLEANYATIDTLEADYATIEKLEADYATIDKLESEYAKIESLETKYANIDFANIGEAAIEKLFSESGIIDALVMSEGHVTGKLVGVTIKGDLIEGGTIVADKLVIKGENGLYYKLNTNGESVSTEQTEYNSLSGSIITANTITAEKINVDDLVAFDATIGGFHITDDAIYSGVKENVNNTTRGIYLDNTGQIAFGDSSNYVKYFKDTDGKWKIDISASVIRLGSSNKTVEDYIDEKADEASASAAQEAATPVLRIDSSRGTVFKNNAVSTILTVAIYKGGERITDVGGMKTAFGSSAYLQWHWQRLDEDRFGVLSADDPKISNGGFTLTLTPDDVDVKVTFMCELITS